MENVLPSSDLYSHFDGKRGKLLEDHLKSTVEVAKNYLAEKRVNIISPAVLEKLVTICCLCHDVGKATSYFQGYLLNGKIENAKLKEHSLLSSVVAYFVAKEEFDTFHEGVIDSEFLAFLTFLVVRRHHSNLVDAISEINIKADVLERQVQSIDAERFSILGKHLIHSGLNVQIDKDRVAGWIKKAPNELARYRRKLRRLLGEERLDFYILTNFVFSLLIDADKSEVVIGQPRAERSATIRVGMVDRYKKSLNFRKTYMNAIREEAYREVLSKEADPGQRFYSITLPTGCGKTLTCIAFAFKLKEAVERKYKAKTRIIYSLPFLSIIEQNAKCLREMFVSCGVNPDSSLLLEHHHLAEIYYDLGGEELDTDESKFLIEGWNSRIIVTTFVQLFHSIFSNRNASLRKFHRLANSIIILDEVQAIPCKYWGLVNEMMKELAEKLNLYIILVTATQPLIFNEKEICLLADRENYFKKMSRVVIKPRLSGSMTLEALVQTLSFDEEKSYLFVFNTIGCAREFYRMLKEKVKEKIVYLSTHVTPFERMQRIEEIKEGKARFAISTQLIEAGVDIDFDVVYRDIAPLDSINQTAGRCNRSWEKRGEVIVVELEDKNGRSYSSYIYDCILLDVTRDILKRYETIEESAFMEILEAYYRELVERKELSAYKELLHAVCRMKYECDDGTACVADFRLIENDRPRFDVFVELNDEARRLWEKYLKLKEIGDLHQRRLEFYKIKPHFYRYVVSVPQNIQNLPPFIEGFEYVSYNSLNDYYDSVTGFKCEGELAIW